MRRFVLFVLLSLLTAPLVANAITAPATFAAFIQILLDIVKILLPVVVLGSLLAFFWGIGRFIGSAGDEKNLASGKQLMIWGIVGLFVMVSVWGIISFLTGSFGFEFGLPLLPQ
jgi:hypothetical protein